MALLRKIADDPEVADEIVGFHAQQAAEKALKAMLERRSIDYPYTHDLARLLKLLEGPGGAPATRDDMLALTPWATESRYGDAMPASGDTLAFRPIRERAARQRRLSPCVGSQRASSRAGRGP